MKELLLQTLFMMGLSFLFIIVLYFVLALADIIEDKILVKRALKHNWITNGHCFQTQSSGVFSNVGYSGMYEMVATYTYKVGSNTYSHKKRFYPNKNGEFNYNSDATVYYDGNKPYKCVIM